MNIEKTLQGENTVIKPQGRMDINTSLEFEKYCSELIQAGTQKMVVDMGGLEYVSSAGLRAIISTAKKLKANQGTFALCGARGAVKDVLALSGIGTAITVRETLEDCLTR